MARRTPEPVTPKALPLMEGMTPMWADDDHAGVTDPAHATEVTVRSMDGDVLDIRRFVSPDAAADFAASRVATGLRVTVVRPAVH